MVNGRAGMDDDPVRVVLDETSDRLRAMPLSRPTRALATGVTRALRQQDVEDVVQTLSVLQSDLRAIERVVTAALDRLLAAETQDALRHPFGDAWMRQLRRSLAASPGDQDSGSWLQTWFDAWSEALAASRWDRCADVVALRRESDQLAADLRTITEHLRDGVPEAALAAVFAVLDRGDAPAATVVRLRVLASRCMRRLDGHDEEARSTAAAAVQRSRVTSRPLRALALAAEAEALVHLDRLDEATRLLEPTATWSDSSADLILAAASIATARGDHGRARELHDTTALRFGIDATVPHLLRMVPGNLLWRTARRVRLTDPHAALDLYRRAITMGITGRGRHPERRLHLELAELLSDLDRPAEAAESYRHAADLYGDAGSSRALRLYAKAAALAPDVAENHWALGEALRTSVASIAGTAPSEETSTSEDPERVLRWARRALEEGLSRATPDRSSAWALVSLAMTCHELGDRDQPTVLIERALLLDPGNARTHAFLVQVLRERGLAREAASTVDRHAGGDQGDESLAAQLALALADLGQFRAGVDVLEHFESRWVPSAQARLARAYLLLRGGEHRAAAAVAEPLAADEEIQEEAVYLTALCRHAQGDADAERRLLESLWDPAVAAPSAVAGWTALRLGHVAEAVEFYERRVAQRRPTGEGRSDALDLGLALLARGDPDLDDLARGRAVLAEAVAATWVADELSFFLEVDLPSAQEAGGRTSAAPAAAVLDEVRELAAARLDVLRAGSRPADDLGRRLASAREAAAEGRHEEALSAYRGLLVDGGPAECVHGLEVAAEHQLRRGDDLLAAGDPTAARAAWRALDGVRDIVRPDGRTDVPDAAAARLALVELQLAGARDPAAVHALAAASRRPLVEALPLFATDVRSVWQLRDDLSSLSASAEHGQLVDTLAGLADEVPLDGVYGLVPALEDELLVPFQGAIGLVLGAGHAHLQGSAALHEALADLRDRLTAETGVRVPGVRVGVDTGLPADGARCLVYDRPAGDVAVPLDGPDPAAAVVTGISDVLRNSMFRWISADDVALWAAGWDLGTPHDAEPPAVPADPLQRLRLARLLRMLLREGVPVRDRAAILAGFRDAERRGLREPLAALAVLRRRLGLEDLAGAADPVGEPVPADLLQRLRAGWAVPEDAAKSTGLSGLRMSWELPRVDAVALVRDLRSWRATAAAAGPVMVTTDDDGQRLVLARLLAADRPRVYVLRAGEGA